MPRATMGTLITRLRDLIGDPAGASQVWTDDQLQTRLDARQVQILNANLRQEFNPATGQFLYLDYYADFGDWEEDLVLVNGAWNTVTPLNYDYEVGHFHFATEPQYPLYVTGKSYDLYGAAADTLRAWAAKVSLQYDFQDGNQARFMLSQQAKALRELADDYLQQARPRVASQVRNDVGATGALTHLDLLRRVHG